MIKTCQDGGCSYNNLLMPMKCLAFVEVPEYLQTLFSFLTFFVECLPFIEGACTISLISFVPFENNLKK